MSTAPVSGASIYQEIQSFYQRTSGIAYAAGIQLLERFAKAGAFWFVVRVRTCSGVAELPFNREQYWESATCVRAELMDSIAFHAGFFRYSRVFDQGFIRETLP